MSRPPRTLESLEYLEAKRREVNAALALDGGAVVDVVGSDVRPFRFQGRLLANDFGPWHGFASLGSFYGQNRPGFRWPARRGR